MVHLIGYLGLCGQETLQETGTVFVRRQTILGTRGAYYLRKRVNLICSYIKSLPRLCKKSLPGTQAILQAIMNIIGSRKGI